MSDHADVGYLSWEQWRRFRTAVENALIIVPWLRAAGHIRSGVEEVRAPSSNHPLVLPQTWLAAEEIDRLSKELRHWADLEDIANDDWGQQVARDFTREVETALARWPIEDKAHDVKHLRCQGCVGETIRYTPPGFDGDNTTIACTECGRNYTEDEFATLIELLTTEMKRSEETIGRARRMGAA